LTTKGQSERKEVCEGVWSGLPMPWNDNEDLDRSALVQTLDRCVRTGSHGIYTGGTTGEFHAMGERQFRTVVETFMNKMRDHEEVGIQVGCGGFSLRQVCERIQVAVANGCSVIQLSLPGWEPLRDDEVMGFFEAVVQRFPEITIVVYDNPRSGRTIGPDLWPRLLDAFPVIVGAKIAGLDEQLVRLLRSVRPEFNIFAGESNIVALWPHGARSLAAWISYAFPGIIFDLWQALENGDAAGISAGARKLEIISKHIKKPMRSMGYRSGLMDRLTGLASGFLEPVYARVLAPWRSIDPADVKITRERITQHLGRDCLYREG